MRRIHGILKSYPSSVNYVRSHPIHLERLFLVESERVRGHYSVAPDTRKVFDT